MHRLRLVSRAQATWAVQRNSKLINVQLPANWSNTLAIRLSSRWKQKLVLSNELKPWKIKKADVSSVSPSSEHHSKSFTMVIQLLSTRLTRPNFYIHLSHRHSTTVSLETRNLSSRCEFSHSKTTTTTSTKKTFMIRNINSGSCQNSSIFSNGKCPLCRPVCPSVWVSTNLSILIFCQAVHCRNYLPR